MSKGINQMTDEEIREKIEFLNEIKSEQTAPLLKEMQDELNVREQKRAERLEKKKRNASNEIDNKTKNINAHKSDSDTIIGKCFKGHKYDYYYVDEKKGDTLIVCRVVSKHVEGEYNLYSGSIQSFYKIPETVLMDESKFTEIKKDEFFKNFDEVIRQNFCEDFFIPFTRCIDWVSDFACPEFRMLF